MRIVGVIQQAVRHWRRNGQYWTARKAANALLARLACRLRLRYVPALPVVAKIEATNACNGTCVLCPTARKAPGGRALGRIPFERYCDLIDKLKRTLLTVDITNWGESLLHPRILDMVRYAHAAGIYTYLSTNLHTVRPDQYDGLMTCGLDELALSLHGLSPRTYEAYQPGYRFEEAREVIDRLVEARRRLGRGGKPKLKANFVVTAINEHEAAELPAFAARHGIDCVLSEPSLNLRFEVDAQTARHNPDRAAQLIHERFDRWLPKHDGRDRPIFRRLLNNPALMYQCRKIVPCDWPWTKIVFNYDGAVSVCCGSYRSADDLAQHDGEDIWALWNSRPYRQSRSSFRKDHRPGQNGDRVLCEQCPGVLL